MKNEDIYRYIYHHVNANAVELKKYIYCRNMPSIFMILIKPQTSSNQFATLVSCSSLDPSCTYMQNYKASTKKTMFNQWLALGVTTARRLSLFKDPPPGKRAPKNKKNEFQNIFSNLQLTKQKLQIYKLIFCWKNDFCRQVGVKCFWYVSFAYDVLHGRLFFSTC